MKKSLVLFGLLLLACDETSECETARKTVIGQVESVCNEPAYERTGFCTTCVERYHVHSVTDGANCECRPLTFHRDFCTYSTGDEAIPAVRAALDFVAETCPSPNPPGSNAGELGTGGNDPGTAGAAGEPP